MGRPLLTSSPYVFSLYSPPDLFPHPPSSGIHMAPISALSGSTPDTAKQILDSIEAQFQLAADDLITITNQFLEDFRVGLSEYNRPMAMM